MCELGSPPLGFAYTVADDGEVRVLRDGRVVVVLRGAAAVRFRRDVENGDPAQVMARVSGNYKRGNERQARQHPRNQFG
jgi:hypothetical protein